MDPSMKEGFFVTSFLAERVSKVTCSFRTDDVGRITVRVVFFVTKHLWFRFRVLVVPLKV